MIIKLERYPPLIAITIENDDIDAIYETKDGYGNLVYEIYKDKIHIRDVYGHWVTDVYYE